MFLPYQEFLCSSLTGLTQKILAGLAGCNFCGAQLLLASLVPNTHTSYSFAVGGMERTAVRVLH